MRYVRFIQATRIVGVSEDFDIDSRKDFALEDGSNIKGPANIDAEPGDYYIPDEGGYVLGRDVFERKYIPGPPDEHACESEADKSDATNENKGGGVDEEGNEERKG